MGKRTVILAIVALALTWLTHDAPGARSDEGRAEKAERGELVIPVNATGTVAAYELVELKSKASGRVLEIFVGAGQMVKAGTVLVRLDPVDEQRNMERLQ